MNLNACFYNGKNLHFVDEDTEGLRGKETGLSSRAGEWDQNWDVVKFGS